MTPCAIATCATDAPGATHSARIWAFSAALWVRRVRFMSVSIVSMMKLIVDTIVGGLADQFKMGRLDAHGKGATL